MTSTAMESAATETPESQDTAAGSPPDARPKPGQISIARSTAVSALVIAALGIVAAVLGVQLWLAHNQIADRSAAAADEKHAEQLARDYAVGAATINYQDLGGWTGKLKAGTTPALAAKFDATAPKLEQILTPLKWSSTATPIAAKVESTSGGVYRVDVFVDVNSTSAQTPDGGRTTVTYTVTLDKNADWQITDVGGTAAALPVK